MRIAKRQSSGIKPCPFCGSNKVTIEGGLDEDTRHNDIGCSVCMYCNGRGPWATGSDIRVLSFWNRRKDSPSEVSEAKRIPLGSMVYNEPPLVKDAPEDEEAIEIPNLPLQACPFCSSTNVSLETLAPDDELWWVSCGNCVAQGPHPEYPGENTAQKAVDDWNRRSEQR